MKGRFLTIVITTVTTVILILLAVFFIFGFNKKPETVMSATSPDQSYEAYVVENPSPDPPNQSLFISKTGTGEFRLVASLPEDIEMAHKIIWTEDGRIVVIVTNWHLFITDVQTFNSKKISLNSEWWKWHGNRKTFSSSGKSVVMEQLKFTGSESLTYRTSLMTQQDTISLADI